VRFTVTALGSAGDRPVGVVVGTIARYLIAPDQQPGATAGPPPDRPAGEGSMSRYYADRGDTPGRWLGQGAGELNLQGTVDFDEFTTVLAGRDPRTGARLISGRGSSGRVASVGAGTAACWSPAGEALYSVRDAAAVLGWCQADVRQAIDDGERLVESGLIATLTGTPVSALTGRPEPSGRGPGRHSGRYRDTGTGPPGPARDPGAVRDDPRMALVPFIDGDATRYISDRELSRVEDLVARGVTAAEVLAVGHPGDELSIPAAARLVGVRRGYLARMCSSYLDNRDEITAALDEGDTPKRTYLVCRREEDGSYRVSRTELAAYAERRRRPAVRVGYDVTATTEKSISVLALLGGPLVRREALAAVEAANDAGLRWLEYHTAAARARGEVMGVTGWTVASFQHLTSRRLDPFVHYHNVVANTVVDEHGDRRALDARRLYRSVSAAPAIATAQVRWELTSRLGVAWRPARHGGWEIAGIADPVLDEFSQRRREINDAICELEDALGRASTLDELQSVVTTTRPAKTAADEADLLAEWRQRAGTHGLTPTALHQTLGRTRPTVLTAPLRARILDTAAAAVTAERSIFTRGDLLAILVDLPHPNAPDPSSFPPRPSNNSPTSCSAPPGSSNSSAPPAKRTPSNAPTAPASPSAATTNPNTPPPTCSPSKPAFSTTTGEASQPAPEPSTPASSKPPWPASPTSPASNGGSCGRSAPAGTAPRPASAGRALARPTPCAPRSTPGRPPAAASWVPPLKPKPPATSAGNVGSSPSPSPGTSTGSATPGTARSMPAPCS
jgi:conjugative relaxase-like TrwC/TraI family protein